MGGTVRGTYATFSEFFRRRDDFPECGGGKESSMGVCFMGGGPGSYLYRHREVGVPALN